MFTENSTRQTALGSLEKALDPNLTDADLAVLSRSEEAKIRAAVAERPETPLTSLLRLSTDSSSTVRVGVARNRRPEMPEDVFDQLSRDKSVDVLFALIENPMVPDTIIGRLARHYHKEYAGAARARLGSKGGSAKVLGMFGIASGS